MALVIVVLVLYYAMKFIDIQFDNMKVKKETQKEDKLTVLRQQVSTTVQALLERTVLRTQASRVCVNEFHNGTKTTGGLPFLKMSCTYEALNEGVNSVAHNRQDLPMQLYNVSTEALFNNPYIIIDTNNRTDIDSALGYETLAKLGIAVAARVKITNIEKKAIGYVSAEWSEPADDKTLQHAAGILQDIATELGALLSVNPK